MVASLSGPSSRQLRGGIGPARASPLRSRAITGHNSRFAAVHTITMPSLRSGMVMVWAQPPPPQPLQSAPEAQKHPILPVFGLKTPLLPSFLPFPAATRPPRPLRGLLASLSARFRIILAVCDPLSPHLPEQPSKFFHCVEKSIKVFPLCGKLSAAARPPSGALRAPGRAVAARPPFGRPLRPTAR